MSEDQRMVEFNRLNPVGKVIFVAGSAFKTIGALVDFTVGAVGTVWTEAEKAFSDGKSEGPAAENGDSAAAPGVEDAVVLEEHEDARMR